MIIKRLVLIALLTFCFSSLQADFKPNANNKAELAVAGAIIDIKEADSKIQRFFDDAVAYAVFPDVGKGGIGIGGAHGKGLVIANGKVIGDTELSQLTIGLQLGAQVYAEFIFFKDDAALGNFQRGNYELGAQASAVAASAGASANADYDGGVAIFTQAGGGLMYEATVGGQKFKYTSR
jgi:lipid-binding SYLF domain-containing protein